MCMNCSGTCSPGHVRELPDLAGHEHLLEFVGVRMYEVYICHGCGAIRIIPLLDRWREK